LFDSAINLYKKVDPKLKIKNRELELIFSSGATLKFAYLDNPSDKYNFQGAELTFIGFDEIQQLSQENVIYLFSRLRSTTVDYKKQIVATGNPDYNSFMRQWVEFALDERGIPIRKEVYPKRYFIQIPGGNIEWSDSLEDLQSKYGYGDDSGIMSMMYVPGNIMDNPPLLKADPTYLSKLKALPTVERERLLDGSWYARESASGYWKRAWINEILYPPAKVIKTVRSWDLAYTLPNESSSKNPDFTCGVKMAKDSNHCYNILDMVRFRERSHTVEKTIFETAKSDGSSVIITLPLDPSGGGAYVRGIQKRLSEAGFICRLIKPVKSKVERFAPFAAVAEGGFVNVVKASWNDDFHTELENFDGSNKFKDDQVDVCSDAFKLLNQDINLPSFSLPDLTSTPSFGYQSIDLPTNTNVVKIGEFTT
jgi:predicted phage terminase large subunit-like protein